MENELRNEINRLREQLRVASTVHAVVQDGEYVCCKDKHPAIFSNAADAELFCAEQREKYSGFFSVRTIEVK